MKHEQTAVDILKNNHICVLGTATKDGRPWTTPVAYTVDGEGNFYWSSARDARHSKLIEQNNQVSLVVIDDRKPEGLYANTFKVAVYVEGAASEIPFEELEAAIVHRYPDGKRTAEDFNPKKQHRSVYRLIPTHIHSLVDPEIIHGVKTDKRVELDLAALKDLLA